MITNCGPLVLRHDAKGPQVVITYHAYVASWLPAAPVDNVYSVGCTLQLCSGSPETGQTPRPTSGMSASAR